METTMKNPTAVFMAFGTQGDVYPIAAIAIAFACDQEQYRVCLITHSAHENLAALLGEKKVDYFPVSSPPVLSLQEESAGLSESSFHEKKKNICSNHRRECLSLVERIFGNRSNVDGDFVVINFFALEGWSLAEIFHVRCVIAAPYVVPYSAPASFERQFRGKLPLLYKYLKEAPAGKVCWEDVIHWMWPLFTEEWGSWRSAGLNLSPCPFMDPVTDLPAWHDRFSSPLLLYGFSKNIVECPEYWPPNVHICGFWFLPIELQFSCERCRSLSDSRCSGKIDSGYMCLGHAKLQCFLNNTLPTPPIFIGLSSVGSMGFLSNPLAFLRVLQSVLERTSYKVILFSAGYEPLNAVAQMFAAEESCSLDQKKCGEDELSLFEGRLICYSGTIPYNWLFTRCLAAVHHGGSGSTAAALHAGIPQVICPFMGDQFYWGERMSWLGVAPEPLKRKDLLPDEIDDLSLAHSTNVLLKALNYALSSEVRAHASRIAELISHEDGVSKAVDILKKEVCSSKSNMH